MHSRSGIAGLVFQMSNETGVSTAVDVSAADNASIILPTYISYKIRMDTDRVDSTLKFRVMDRFSSRLFI